MPIFLINVESHNKIIHSNKEIMIYRTQCLVCRHKNVVKLYIPVLWYRLKSNSS